MTRDATRKKKGFYRYIKQKIQVHEGIFPLVNVLVTVVKEKAEILNNFLCISFHR